MPSALSYPGVYIEEVPSGVRTITGVATSIAAFVGRASRGPVGSALTVNSYGEFERLFGGLWQGSALPFAVRDFFLNGGAQAVVVRLYHTDTAGGAASPAAAITLSTGAAATDKFTLEGASPGKWGEALRASLDVDVSEAVATSFGLAKTDLFNLTVRDTSPGGATEVFRNLSLKDSPRRIDQVLKVQSALLRWKGAFPPGTLPTIAAADDDISKAEKQLKTAQAAQPPVPADIAAANTALTAARAAIAANDGLALALSDFNPANGETNKQGLYALEQTDLFNLLCLPPYLSTGDVDTGLVSLAAAYCEKRRALLLVDPPSSWVSKQTAKTGVAAGIGTTSKNAALYFPRLRQPNPLRDNQSDDFVPCGAVAGVMARTDVSRGVWKAPAGLDATLNNVPALSVSLTDPEIGELNPLAVNCLRPAPAAGRVVWGARTLQGDDRLASEWKYVPVRRLALFLEESLYRGTQWVVFEPNDEPLWAQIRLNLGAFMNGLFRQGAFQGASPREAYFVKCDKETTTQADINLGIVNIVVGFAPLKPAEFVVIKLQQIAGQLAA